MQAWRDAARSRPEWMHSTANPRALSLCHLVFHQGDQRTHHQRGTAASDAGKLVAQGFAGARRHNHQNVATVDDGGGRPVPVPHGTWGTQTTSVVVLRAATPAFGNGAAAAAAGFGSGGGGWGPFPRGTAGTCPTLPTTSRTYSSMPSRKGSSCAVPRLDPVEIGLPLTGHGRTLHLRMDDLDEVNALVRSFEAFAVAYDVLALQQDFDDRRPRSRCAQPGFLHGIRQLFFIQRLAGRFHGRQESCFCEPLRWPGLFPERLRVHDILRLIGPRVPAVVPPLPERPSSISRAPGRELSSRRVVPLFPRCGNGRRSPRCEWR